MPEHGNDKTFRLVQDGHEPVVEAPYVPAAYCGKLTLARVIEINAAYALQVVDRTCRVGETIAIGVLEGLSNIIRG